MEKESSILAKLEKSHTVTDKTGTAVVSKKRVAKELKMVTAAAQAGASAAQAGQENFCGVLVLKLYLFFLWFLWAHF